MSNLRQAAEMALNALENHTAIKHPQQIHYRDAAIEALRTALAEEALQRLTDVQQDIEAALAEPNKCTHGVTDGNCKECYMAEPEQEPMVEIETVLTVQGEPDQEPVAWMDREGDLYKMPEIKNWAPPHTMLYTTPPQRKPLTEEEMFKLWVSAPAETEDRFAFARAIEAAHGIKGDA